MASKQNKKDSSCRRKWYHLFGRRDNNDKATRNVSDESDLETNGSNLEINDRDLEMTHAKGNGVIVKCSENCKGCKCEDLKDRIDGNGSTKMNQMNVDKKKTKKNLTPKKDLSFVSCCSQEETSSSSSSSPHDETLDNHDNQNPFTYSTSIENLAYMPVSKSSPFYNMNHIKRGKAVIFNFDRWENTSLTSLDHQPRHGSLKDERDLANCLGRKLEFEVQTYDNLKNMEFWEVLDELQQYDHSDNDCLIVAIMTHGLRNHIYLADGTLTPVKLIWEHFEAHLCKTLAAKPKIFILQACRGTKYDHGISLHPRATSPPLGNQSMVQQLDVTDSGSFSYTIPNAADIIVAFSCPPGYYAWRNPEKGSWFIQSICKVFNEKAFEMDVQSLFTDVAREVALYHESNTTEFESNKKRQVTSTSSTLIRAIQFKPKHRVSCVNNVMNGMTTMSISRQQCFNNGNGRAMLSGKSPIIAAQVHPSQYSFIDGQEESQIDEESVDVEVEDIVDVGTQNQGNNAQL